MCYTGGSFHPRPSTRFPYPQVPRRTCCGAPRFFESVKRNPPTYTPLPLTYNFPTTPRRPRAEVLALIERDRDGTTVTIVETLEIEYYYIRYIGEEGNLETRSGMTKVDRYVFRRRGNRKKGGASVVRSDRWIPIAWECTPLRGA